MAAQKYETGEERKKPKNPRGATQMIIWPPIFFPAGPTVVQIDTVNSPAQLKRMAPGTQVEMWPI